MSRLRVDVGRIHPNQCHAGDGGKEECEEDNKDVTSASLMCLRIRIQMDVLTFAHGVDGLHDVKNQMVSRM
jgi:hypothetical protein